MPAEPYVFPRRTGEPGRIIEPPRRRWWVPVACALVVAAIAWYWFRGRLIPPPQGVPFVVSSSKGSLITGGYSGWVGFRMTVGPAALSITDLGRAVTQDNSRTHTIKLVDASTGIDVPGGTVQISLKGRAPGSIAYASLGTPVRLDPGGSYYIVSSEAVSNNTGDFFHDFNSHLETNNVASIDSAVCLEGGKWKPYGQAGNSFGPIDFRYILASY